MSEQHITHILESTRFASLSESDHSRIRAHTASCDDCARAYRVAAVSASLLENRMAETFEPSPFFHTRVLAAVREKQNEGPVARSRCVGFVAGRSRRVVCSFKFWRIRSAVSSN